MVFDKPKGTSHHALHFKLPASQYIELVTEQCRFSRVFEISPLMPERSENGGQRFSTVVIGDGLLIIPSENTKTR